MTEKRFTMKGSTILENGEEITAWDCYDLLNELHEENKRLKSDLAHTKVLYHSLQDKYSGLLKLVHGFKGDVE